MGKTKIVESNEISQVVTTYTESEGMSTQEAAAQFALASELSSSIRNLAKGSPEAIEETIVIKSKKESTVVGSRPMTEEARTEIHTKRKYERIERASSESPTMDCPCKRRKPQALQMEGTTNLPVIWDAHYHFIHNYSFLDYTIQLEDGSIWQLSPADIYAMPSWAANDILIITPNHLYDPIFCPYKYCITNQTTGTYVMANLTVGPDLFYPYLHRVTLIDYLLNRIYLDDGTYWEIDPLDYYLLQYWAPGDFIIIGDNDDDFSLFDTMLINVTVNEYIRAQDF